MSIALVVAMETAALVSFKIFEDPFCPLKLV